jgi:sulfur carrier protein
MLITVNDTEYNIENSMTVKQLLEAQQISPIGLAVAINHSVLAKRQWSEHYLQPNDAVQLFQIVTGG